MARAFEPLMTLYLTDTTSPDEIRRGRESGFVHAVKLYPAGATTNSESGVTNLRRCAFALEEMQRVGMPLLIHGEVTRPQIDVFDRERVFIDEVLIPMRRDFPALKIVFEHITTKDAVELRSRSARPNRRHDHCAPSAVESQFDFFWSRWPARIKSASLLLASIEARDASASVDGSRNQWKLAIFSRYRFSAACERRQGVDVRLRRMLHSSIGA